MRSSGFPPFRRQRPRPFARRPRLVDLAGALGAILLLALAGAEVKRRFLPPTVITGFGEAVDGDSLKVGGEMVRLKGVDAPEFNQSCADAAGRAYDCGAESRRWLQGRLRRGSVRCEIDGRDRYGRPLGWCVVAEESLNAAIVRAGLAVDYGGHAAEEREARRLRAGLWAGSFTPPAEWRASHSRDGATPRAN